MKKFLISLVALSAMISPAVAKVPPVITQVQKEFNHKIKYVADPVGQDIWTVATTQGDCEDIALAKRQALIDSGWSKDDLQILILMRQDAHIGPHQWEGHVVLYVPSQKIILDQQFENYVTDYNVYMTTYNWKVICVATNLTEGSIPTLKRCQ